MDPTPTCRANTGWKGHDRPCGGPATRVAQLDDGPLFMCEDHAILCADQTGAVFELVDGASYRARRSGATRRPTGHDAVVEPPDVVFEVEADGRCVVKLQAPSWELNVRARAEDFRRLAGICDAAWDARGSIQVGEVAGAPAYWSCLEQTVTVLVGADDEVWDLAVLVPLPVVDEIVRLASADA